MKLAALVFIGCLGLGLAAVAEDLNCLKPDEKAAADTYARLQQRAYVGAGGADGGLRAAQDTGADSGISGEAARVLREAARRFSRADTAQRANGTDDSGGWVSDRVRHLRKPSEASHHGKSVSAGREGAGSGSRRVKRAQSYGEDRRLQPAVCHRDGEAWHGRALLRSDRPG